MKNRWLAIIIAVAALLSLISGCGNSGSSAASAASADSAVPASEPEERAGQPETTEPDLENSEASEASVEPEPQEAENTIEYPISDEIVEISLVTTVPPYMIGEFPASATWCWAFGNRSNESWNSVAGDAAEFLLLISMGFYDCIFREVVIHY